MAAFQRGLSEEGNFVEGQNVAIEYRWSESQNEQFPTLAADIVDRQVDCHHWQHSRRACSQRCDYNNSACVLHGIRSSQDRPC
jgi:hypothetical protein